MFPWFGHADITGVGCEGLGVQMRGDCWDAHGGAGVCGICIGWAKDRVGVKLTCVWICNVPWCPPPVVQRLLPIRQCVIVMEHV